MPPKKRSAPVDESPPTYFAVLPAELSEYLIEKVEGSEFPRGKKKQYLELLKQDETVRQIQHFLDAGVERFSWDPQGPTVAQEAARHQEGFDRMRASYNASNKSYKAKKKFLRKENSKRTKRVVKK